jgi:hypothetical protein
MASPCVVHEVTDEEEYQNYCGVTCFDTDPHRLLRTVILRGFLGQLSCPLYLRPPLLFSVPINSPDDVTNA